MDIDFGFDAQRHLHVFFVGDGNVNVLRQFAHHLNRGFAPFPKILAVVQVAGDGNSLCPSGLSPFQGQVSGGSADGRSNPGYVEPAGIPKGFIPVDVAGLGKRNRAALAIVDDLGGALIGTGLDIVHPHTALAAHDTGCVHSEAAQFRDHRVANGIFLRENGHEGCRQAQLRQGDRHVGLAAAEGGHKLRSLQDSLETRRGQPKHDFAERNGRVRHAHCPSRSPAPRVASVMSSLSGRPLTATAPTTWPSFQTGIPPPQPTYLGSP